MKKLTGVLLFICITIFVQAQEKPFFRAYFLNRYLLNPAVSGSQNCSVLHFTDHHQWIGVENAPSSQTVSFQTSFDSYANNKHGLGGIVYNDINGPHKKTGFQFSYSHHILLDDRTKSRISFGVSASGYQYAFDASMLNPRNPDPILGGGESVFMPNANAGIYFYSKKLFAGISGANLVPEVVSVQNAAIQPDMDRIYTVISGYRFNTSRFMNIQPSLAIITDDNFEKNIHLNSKFNFKSFWMGLTYRHNLSSELETQASAIVAAGINIKQFFVAYAHSFGLGKTQPGQFSSAYIKLGYRFCKDDKTGSSNIDQCPAYW